MNRWIVPMTLAALLAGPAVLLGWNAPAVAVALADPWVDETTASIAPGASGPVLVVQAPAPLEEPRDDPATEATSEPAPVPPQRSGRSVVHTVTHTVGTTEKEDDVSETPNTRPSEEPGPIEPSDPTNPVTGPTPAPDQDNPGGAVEGEEDRTVTGDPNGESEETPQEPVIERRPAPDRRP